jgi:hypothetical protein
MRRLNEICIRVIVIFWISDIFKQIAVIIIIIFIYLIPLLI